MIGWMLGRVFCTAAAHCASEEGTDHGGVEVQKGFRFEPKKGQKVLLLPLNAF